VLQRIRGFEFSVTPVAKDLVERRDFFGNRVWSFSIQESHQELVIETGFQAQIIAYPPPIDELTMTCGQIQKALHGDTSFRNLQALQYIYPSPMISYSKEIEQWAAGFFPAKRPFIEGVAELNQAIYEMMEFQGGATEVNTSVDEFFQLKKGVCQDFAHLMIAAIRSQDLPARYVSGYILTLPPEGEERLEGADASHAWVSVNIPGYGWIDFDPTNNLMVSDHHIRIAIGRDYNDVSPVRGSTIGGGESQLTVEVTVSPVEASENNLSQNQSQVTQGQQYQNQTQNQSSDG